MTIKIYYTDLRARPSKLEKYEIDCRAELTAFDAIVETAGITEAKKISDDLARNNQDLIVSWHNRETDEISEIGGIGTLDWLIEDNITLTVNYENETTTQTQINEADAWAIKNEQEENPS